MSFIAGTVRIERVIGSAGREFLKLLLRNRLIHFFIVPHALSIIPFVAVFGYF